MIKKITNNDISQVLKSNAAVVDFSATWCGPCKMIEPVLEELSEEMGDIEFYNADVDENMDIAMNFGIQSIPAVLIFKNGKQIDSSIGFLPKPQLKDFIEKSL